MALLPLLLLLAIHSILAARLIFSEHESDGVRSTLRSSNDFPSPLGEKEDSSQKRCVDITICSPLLPWPQLSPFSPVLPLPQSPPSSSSSPTPDTLSFCTAVFSLWRPCLEHITNLHSCLPHLPPLSPQSHLLRELLLCQLYEAATSSGSFPSLQ